MNNKKQFTTAIKNSPQTFGEISTSSIIEYYKNNNSRNEQKKNRSKNRKKDICSKITAANVYFIICACVLIYTIAIPVLAMILEHWGEQTEATITSNTSTLFHRWSVSCYMYEFGLYGQIYTGNSLIKEGESDSIGKKIKVYYFKKFPSFNRPLSYYDN